MHIIWKLPIFSLSRTTFFFTAAASLAWLLQWTGLCLCLILFNFICAGFSVAHPMLQRY
jgi:hypothetical protein